MKTFFDFQDSVIDQFEIKEKFSTNQEETQPIDISIWKKKSVDKLRPRKTSRLFVGLIFKCVHKKV